MSKEELEQRGYLEAFLDQCSEDELIEGVLLPLFRQLKFQRISPTGHVDKGLNRVDLPTKAVPEHQGILNDEIPF
ncbi:MAG: hypothetical protein EOS25_03770 [Mesorhizobium sp.]|uniref:hypothetical protein n=1 Tax=Mesorhizobium sp. TaxID=1871066 RepID=UPI000FE693BB|nr:hypothetical protein [Mesorhizobium sp.]RWD52310.1 MAG: hypothetical protein EOS59_03710 [Mesorhizobium sp.]RWE61917.1 MAG: hypothetical protein EOS24_09330 [Mesorhizobium sp.]RWF12083.1 MAG: hypothetical protein EOS69_05560 [Mesorhizobium sp.]RWF21829.1 MAG: hypothetical protein EOS25_03770 [Mesorhizobium sp.]TIY01919.1 MAG: hypothetical protein E5V22_19890 [Mesorhizobium sp.]